MREALFLLTPRSLQPPTPLQSRPLLRLIVSEGLPDICAKPVDLLGLGGLQHFAMTAHAGAGDGAAAQGRQIGAPMLVIDARARSASVSVALCQRRRMQCEAAEFRKSQRVRPALGSET